MAPYSYPAALAGPFSGHGVAFSPDGRLLATASNDGTAVGPGHRCGAIQTGSDDVQQLPAGDPWFTAG